MKKTILLSLVAIFLANFSFASTQDTLVEVVTGRKSVQYEKCDGTPGRYQKPITEWKIFHLCNEKLGCMHPDACNYDPKATNEDGSCCFPASWWNKQEPEMIDRAPIAEREPNMPHSTHDKFDGFDHSNPWAWFWILVALVALALLTYWLFRKINNKPEVAPASAPVAPTPVPATPPAPITVNVYQTPPPTPEVKSDIPKTEEVKAEQASASDQKS